MSEDKWQLRENSKQMVEYLGYHFKSDFYLLISDFFLLSISMVFFTKMSKEPEIISYSKNEW